MGRAMFRIAEEICNVYGRDAWAAFVKDKPGRDMVVAMYKNGASIADAAHAYSVRDSEREASKGMADAAWGYGPEQDADDAEREIGL